MRLDDPVAWLVVALLLALAVALVGWWRAGARTGRENRRRAVVARRGEDEAERLLVASGYEVTHRQETRRFALLVDGEEAPASCRADLLVRDGRGRRWVAEVKTGGATRATSPQTRRQLLEYALVFDVEGVLLVDPAERTIRTVTFPFLEYE